MVRVARTGLRRAALPLALVALAVSGCATQPSAGAAAVLARAPGGGSSSGVLPGAVPSSGRPSSASTVVPPPPTGAAAAVAAGTSSGRPSSGGSASGGSSSGRQAGRSAQAPTGAATGSSRAPVISTAASTLPGTSVAVRTASGGLRVVHSTVSDPEVAARQVAAGTGLEVVAAARPQPVHGMTSNDPQRGGQWAMDALHAEDVWASGRGEGQVIAVVDGGVYARHADLSGQVLPGTDLVTIGEDGRMDQAGHGTHVAGIIAANAGNGIGVAGLAPGVKILPVRVLTPYGGRSDVVAQGVTWAVDHGATVINLSLGGEADDPVLRAAVDNAVARGVVVVVAAGNAHEQGNPMTYPASYPGVIAVGAVALTPVGTRAPFSETGSWVDVAAPGTAIVSTYPGPEYVFMDGTSMACPYVAATAALIRAANPALTPAEVADVIESTATDLGTAGRDDEFGYGMVNPLVAVVEAKARTGGTPTASPTGPRPTTGDLPRTIVSGPLPTSALYGSKVTIAARLLSTWGTPLAARVVTFTRQGIGVTSPTVGAVGTDADGWARITVTVTTTTAFTATAPRDEGRYEAAVTAVLGAVPTHGAVSLGTATVSGTTLTVAGSVVPATGKVAVQRLAAGRWVAVCSLAAKSTGAFSGRCPWPKGVRASVRAVLPPGAGFDGATSTARAAG